MERIVAAAIKVTNQAWGGDMVISQIPPARHHTILHGMYDYNNEHRWGKEQGFLTSEGRYVSREEAYVIAVNANQLLKDQGDVLGKLFSEDLW